MKFDIACGRTVTSRQQSSAQLWRVGEWRLTWNETVESKTANLSGKRNPPRMVGSIGKKTPFL